MKNILIFCFTSGLLLHSAIGSVISVSAARASSEFGGRPAIAAFNGSGLGAGDTHDTNFANMWLTANNNNGQPNTFVEVDLGAVYAIDSVQVWNYNENANATCCLGRGVQTGTLQTATSYNAFGAGLPVGFAQAPGTVTNFSETFAFGGTQARYLRLNVSSNYGDASFTGLSEVRFDGTLVPGQNLPLAIVGATATSEFGLRPAINAANGSGLFGPTHTTAPDGNMWLSNRDPSADITFDLGSSQSIGDLLLWNYNEIIPTDRSRDAELLGRGVNEVNILVSDDNINFSQVLNHNFLIGTGDDTADFSERVSLNATGQYVKLDVVSNHGNVEGWTGISEVQFFAPIPEPSTSALLGVFALALLGRRRRSA